MDIVFRHRGTGVLASSFNYIRGLFCYFHLHVHADEIWIDRIAGFF